MLTTARLDVVKSSAMKTKKPLCTQLDFFLIYETQNIDNFGDFNLR